MRYIIGIDPDTEKNGITVYDNVEKKYIIVTSLNFYKTVKLCEKFTNSKILLEAGFAEKKSNWHGGFGGVAQKIANSAGKNGGIGIALYQYLLEAKFEVVLLKPKGYSSFFKDDKFFRKQTGWVGRTNMDARASCAMVFLNK